MRLSLKERLRDLSVALTCRRIAREAQALTLGDRTRLLHKVAAKTMVFAISSGRAGTQTLARLFESSAEIDSIHEGVPAFHDVMRQALFDPQLARDFLLVRKLPAIAASSRPVYFESSHIFGKGFLIPMLRLGLRPRIVFLRREPRKVALSIERIGATPYRTAGGRAHFLSPADPSLLPVTPWDDFTDYQLCYWYALETIRRQQIKYDAAVRAGCKCRHLRIEDLRSVDDIWKLVNDLGLDIARTASVDAALEARVGRAFNLKEKRPPLLRAPAELDAQERVVIDRIQNCMPELDVRKMVAAHLDARCGPDLPIVVREAQLALA